jgi:hypothetical protein
LKNPFRGTRGYWLGIGVAAFVLLVLLLVWVLPMRAGAARAEEEWNRQMVQFRALQIAVKDIPSTQSLADLKKYREWLDNQAKLVESFFADRAAVLESPLTGEGEATPAAFKEEYLAVVATQRRSLDKNKDTMAFSDLQGAFPQYDWATGASVGYPKPEEYVSILRGYWTRKYMYRAFSDCGVKVVKSLHVGKAVSLTPEFEALPIQIDVAVPPEKITTLVDSLLTVSPAMSGKPVIVFERMAAQVETGSNRLCNLQLDGHILLFKRAAPEKRPELPADKKPAPEPARKTEAAKP